MYPCLDWQYVNVIFRLLMISPLMSIHVHTHQNEERKYKVIDTEYEVKVMKGQKKKKRRFRNATLKVLMPCVHQMDMVLRWKKKGKS